MKKQKKQNKVNIVKVMKQVAREAYVIPANRVEKDLKKDKNKKACRKPVKW